MKRARGCLLQEGKRRTTKTRLAAAFFAAVLSSLILASGVVSPGYSSTVTAAKIKPKYRLSAHLYGTPSTITLNQPYSYTITIKNTGRLKLKKVSVWFANGFTVTGSSLTFKRLPRPNATVDWYYVKWTLTNLRAGATKRITIAVVYKIDHTGEGFELRAQGTPRGKAQVLKEAWYEGH